MKIPLKLIYGHSHDADEALDEMNNAIPSRSSYPPNRVIPEALRASRFWGTLKASSFASLIAESEIFQIPSFQGTSLTFYSGLFLFWSLPFSLCCSGVHNLIFETLKRCGECCVANLNFVALVVESCCVL